MYLKYVFCSQSQGERGDLGRKGDKGEPGLPVSEKQIFRLF